MASLRRSRTTQSDAIMTKFLYTILKQLDLKSIDWQEVANQLDITNGHAARMRYSRFKQQVEGQPAVPRKSKPAVHRQKKAKADKPPGPDERSNQERPIFTIQGEPGIKEESGENAEPMQGIEPPPKVEATVEEEPWIKSEPVAEEGELCTETHNVVDVVVGGSHDGPLQLTGAQGPSDRELKVGRDRQASAELFVPKKEPIVKSEPLWEE